MANRIWIRYRMREREREREGKREDHSEVTGLSSCERYAVL